MSSSFVLPNSYDSLLAPFPTLNTLTSKTKTLLPSPATATPPGILPCSPEVLNLYIQQQQLLQLQQLAAYTSGTTGLVPQPPCTCQPSATCHPHLTGHNPNGFLSFPHGPENHSMTLLYPQLQLGGMMSPAGLSTSSNPPYFQNPGRYGMNPDLFKNSHDDSQSNLPLLPLPIRLSKVSKNLLSSSLFGESKPEIKRSKRKKSPPPSSGDESPTISSPKDEEESRDKEKDKDSPRSAFRAKSSSPVSKRHHSISADCASSPSPSCSNSTAVSSVTNPAGNSSSHSSAFSPPSSPSSTSPCSPSSRSPPLPASPLILSLSPSSAAAAAAAVAAAVAAAQLNRPMEQRKSRGKRPIVNINRKKSVKHACTFPNCGNGFPTRFSLKRHMKRHTGERPFLCPWEDNGIACGRKFGEKSTLKRHIRIHTGEKPFRCSFPTCGKLFADRVNRSRHELTHKRIDEA